MSFAVICTGQGAQSPDLFQKFPFSEKGLSLQRRILEAGCLEPEVADWLAHPSANPDQIYKNHFSQPLLCLYQMMVWAELSLPVPYVFAGYSLGELSAYGCTGALSPEDVVRLAGLRARAMDAAGSGVLIAVTGLPVDRVRTVAEPQGAHVAIVLGESHCVIGCPTNQGDAMSGILLAAGATNAVLLPVSVPSHTPLLDSAVEPFRKSLNPVAWQAPLCPVLAGINASKVLTRQQMTDTLPEQIHRTVRWDLVEQRLAEDGCQVILELGPGCQLAHALLSTRAHPDARSVDEFRSAEGIAEWVEHTLQRFG
ncbi:MAG: ACP S-malonyltransferase [Terrimicrobiaceae bacterium]